LDPAEDLRAPAETTDDLFLGGRLRVLQPRTGHRSGHDALLLAATVPSEARGRLVELGAGVGVAGLAAASRAEALEAVLVEIDEELAAIARENVERNALGARVRVIALDIEAPQADRARLGLPPECADLVILNPPFYQRGLERASPDPRRERAHHEGAGGLEAWIDAAVATARQGGRITVLLRPEALPRLLRALGGRVGGLAILPIHARADRPAVRVIVSGLRGSRAPLGLLPGFVLAEADGRPTREADAVLRGGRGLLLAGAA